MSDKRDLFCGTGVGSVLILSSEALASAREQVQYTTESPPCAGHSVPLTAVRRQGGRLGEFFGLPGGKLEPLEPKGLAQAMGFERRLEEEALQRFPHAQVRRPGEFDKWLKALGELGYNLNLHPLNGGSGE